VFIRLGAGMPLEIVTVSYVGIKSNHNSKQSPFFLRYAAHVLVLVQDVYVHFYVNFFVHVHLHHFRQLPVEVKNWGNWQPAKNNFSSRPTQARNATFFSK
jgi:hypothetical protein